MSFHNLHSSSSEYFDLNRKKGKTGQQKNEKVTIDPPPVLHNLHSSSSEYLDLNKKKGKTGKQKNEKVATDPLRVSNKTAVKLSTWSSSSSTTLSPLTDTSYDSASTASKLKAAKKILTVYKPKVLSKDIESIAIGNPPFQNPTKFAKDDSLMVLRVNPPIQNQTKLVDNDAIKVLRLNTDDSVAKLLGSEDSEYSNIVYDRAAHYLNKISKNERNYQSSSQPEKYLHNHHTRRVSEDEAVQTAGGNIHHSQKEVEHWEYETPLSKFWYISPPEDPKMALISLLVETHRRIIGSREHPNLNFRNNVDYGVSSLQVNYDIDPDCCGCVWPFIDPNEIPENLKDKHGNRKYYFLTAESQGFDWEEQDFSAPLGYLMERRKKLKDLVLMMKEELFYITERFVDLSKKFRHKIVRDSRLRKRFEAVGLDLVYKRAHLDNMHHLYHRVKKLYEAYLPLCHDA